MVLSVLGPAGCAPSDLGDCFQGAGPLERRSVEVADFDRITVFERVRLVVRQGPEARVEIESGARLIEEVTAEVSDGRLLLRNGNRCNVFRDYGLTTVYVTAPELVEIRSSTGLSVSSDGSLAYDDLVLISESVLDPGAETSDGSFDMAFAGGRVRVVVNGISYFRLTGAVDFLEVRVFAGDTRVDAGELLAADVLVDHRGSNDLTVHPIDRIGGVIRGYGDVLSRNRPATIEVDETFNGRLRFLD